MPELPEVAALVNALDAKARGRVIAEGHLVSFAALKTYRVPLTALAGLEIDGVSRHGKFIDVAAQGVHLIVHLARAGWVTWHEVAPKVPAKPGKSGLALRIVLDDGSGFSVTEAGTQKHLAVYVVEDPAEVPGIAALGPDPMDPAFTADDLRAILARAGRAQIKGVLRDQKVLAGIGNAYSDEILHVARLSPFKPADTLDEAAVAGLFGHLRRVLGDAIGSAAGVPIDQLKDAKRAGMRVHGRTGQTCDVCGSTIAEVSFADSSLQYCPGCQTGGKRLADRRMSKLLK
ncbi:DNA lyase [Tessaracoccus lapidicaptus]|uniref:DNA lyase n=1 Tax=Tessaracoccus lapidicaptus TaxID=1427523 RepID=A0A1C0AMP3_9ACTN|nr:MULTISPECIES: DNA-formamidopyrimidine glycosylase family protein [Tessaracoccus]AQX15606.1 endonuclease VIII [Tessaracoccus sp. T2.5-30]OCL33976.1 DNA lyase [Tessaracoccus lapidicaptus]VEP39959.1 putative formamidopyrimidine-DNA glycosylase-like protein [Tessaracoccus lapidicaptus]